MKKFVLSNGAHARKESVGNWKMERLRYFVIKKLVEMERRARGINKARFENARKKAHVRMKNERRLFYFNLLEGCENRSRISPNKNVSLGFHFPHNFRVKSSAFFFHKVPEIPKGRNHFSYDTSQVDAHVKSGEDVVDSVYAREEKSIGRKEIDQLWTTVTLWSRRK